MQTALPLPVAKLKSEFDSLSEEHKAIFEQVLEDERTSASEDDVPQWHLDVLAEREKQWLEGKTSLTPAEESFDRVRERLAQRRMERNA